MTLYLTDNTPADEIRRAQGSGRVVAVKLYPAGATTNSDAGVTDLRRAWPVLDAMQACGMPLLVHGEVTDPAVDVFDREAVFIDSVLRSAATRLSRPARRVRAHHHPPGGAVRRAGRRRAGRDDHRASSAVQPQRDLFRGLEPALVLPAGAQARGAPPGAARRRHRRRCALLPRHRQRAARGATEGARGGCAGCYTAPHAIELYATAFEQAGALERLEAFASFNGPDFYRLPRNTARITLRRESWIVPESLPFGAERIVPLAGGEALAWRLTR